MQYQLKLKILCLIAIVSLSACSGKIDEINTSKSNTSLSNENGNGNINDVQNQTYKDDGTVAGSAFKLAHKASQFLAKATFGPTENDIEQTIKISPNQWLNNQFQKTPTHLLPITFSKLQDDNPENYNELNNILINGLYKNMVTGQDQLRQRMAFALSQIFVVSAVDVALLTKVNAIPAYYDVLVDNAFGNYRDLLEKITLHPAMGAYLNMAGNKKADAASGRVPDENYAREVMQLFSIGLYQLNQDGSLKMQNGKPIETYTNDDVEGLAKVFTGWDYTTSANKFIEPMQHYATSHSSEEKRFLGTVIPANTSGPQSLKIALDTLFNHANVAPFISKQLIQRFIKSNPSGDYIARVARIFNDNGNGVRGDLKAVVKAIFTDEEALSPSTEIIDVGKIREPIIRFTQLLRALNAKSSSDNWLIGSTDNITYGLAQTPLRPSSVFNFYRPNYSPPNSITGNANLLAPEMQMMNTATTIGYYNYINHILRVGVGTAANNGIKDVQFDFTKLKTLAKNANDLVNYLNLLFVANGLDTKTIDEITRALNEIKIPENTTSNINAIDEALLNRAKLAVILVMVQVEYLVQK
jgi:uncharacterized protein (DUF1800 family)